jgi:hypothetical protein
MKKNIFLSIVHDFFACDFFYHFLTDFPRILNYFPYILFLIATALKTIFVSQKNEGKKEMKKNKFFSFFVLMLAPPYFK